MAILRPCLGNEGAPCGVLTTRSRCPSCQSAWEAKRPSRRARGRYDTRYLKLRDRVLREQPWCSVCRTPGDESNPLQVDHVVPVERGGRNERSNLQTLCRRHNAAKRDRI